MSKEKRNDEFDLLKSQIDDLKSLVDTPVGKNPTQRAENELLDSLSNDVEHYHKKVQLKKEKTHVRKEKIIARELQKEKLHLAEQENIADDDVDVSAITAAAAAAAVVDTDQGHNGSQDIDDELEEEDDDDDEDDGMLVDSELEDDEFNGVPIEVNLKKKRSAGDATPPPSSKKRGRNNKSKKVYPWTKAEDEAIVYYKEDQKYSWKKIEEQLDFRHTWQAIQMRYLRNHKSRNEEWSRFMEVKLINSIRKDWENRWKRIGIDLGKDFSSERCIQKNMELCKRMEMEYVKTIFENKEIKTGYSNPFNDIKDPEAHKKLMLVYMGLDSITYEDSDEEEEEEEDIDAPTTVAAAVAASVGAEVSEPSPSKEIKNDVATVETDIGVETSK